MKVSVAGMLFSASALLVAGSSLSASVSPGEARAIAQNTRVIVILRDQVASAPPVRGAMDARRSAVRAAQAPILDELRQSGASVTRSFHLINAVAATVSKSEAARLAAHPLVQAVVPDLAVSAVKRSHVQGKPAGAGGGGSSTQSSEMCNTLEPEALQLTNAAFLNTSTQQAQEVRDGNGRLITGEGVKVAFIADGLDPTIAGFTRADGSSVFVDYEDFSGDPAGTPTDGGEAFGDASSIAAQDDPANGVLEFDISQFVDAAHPLPAPCMIRIRGMAPGASLVGLKVLSQIGLTTNSQFVQAIEYAVEVDNVDVINESFGGNPYPDNANDPISLADNAAVQAGVVVVVSTGDAGSAGTLGSPATDTDVISAGASTQFRLYAQTGYAAIPLGSGGYISNNISSLSSGGFAQSGPRTVDVVAPGDLGWALCSTNPTLYTDCVSDAGTATPVQDFGGTSEAAPLTSGLAALVIQAYRSTHHGANPTPKLVKRIIMSTATDLGAPAFEQGAGLINALPAVYAALAVGSEDGIPAWRNAHSATQSMVLSPTSAHVTALPGTRITKTFTVTNTSSSTAHLTPALESLGPSLAGATRTLTLNPATDPTFPNVNGAPRSYIEHVFEVPAGGQHLDASIAWVTPNPLNPKSPTPIVYFALLDPEGREATYSIPQGFASGYGHVDVNLPQGGLWTAVVWTRPPNVTGSYAGPVQFTWALENYVTAGSVWPSKLTLAPGQSAEIAAELSMPAQPGDSSVAIRFNNAPGSLKLSGLADIPFSLRALVPMTPTGASFTGTLTGGNARPGAGPTQTFAFDVPAGVQSLSLNVEIADNGYALEGLLVDPNGMELSVEPNQDPAGQSLQYSLQLFRASPQPGRWRFVLVQDFTSSGNQTSLPFTARIGLYSASQIIAAQLPNSPSVQISASGDPLTIPVTVTNTGASTQWFFVDARLSTPAVVQLPVASVCASQTLQGACELVWVPPEASSVSFTDQSTQPIDMDAFNVAGYNVGGTGAPDLWALPAATDTVTASLSVPEVPYGPWELFPSLVGPFPAAGAPTNVAVTPSAVATMLPFDPAVSADSGDLWADLILGTQTFNPLVLGPGQSGTINVTITPNGTSVGQQVSGYLYLDTFNSAVSTGDEVVVIPYSYTVSE